MSTMPYTTLPTEQLYREQLLDHYRSPHNYGGLPGADVAASGHNPLCGDTVRVQLQLRHGTVTVMRFTGQGCAISVATASLLSDRITHEHTAAVLQLGLPDIEALLGVQLPPARITCGLLALKAAQRAVRLWRENREHAP